MVIYISVNLNQLLSKEEVLSEISDASDILIFEAKVSKEKGLLNDTDCTVLAIYAV